MASASAWWAAIGLVAMVLALSVPENKRVGWSELQVWAGFAVVCAALVLAPATRDAFRLSAERAWQVAAGGLGGLVFFWVLFVLPDIGRNTSFAATVAVAAAGLALWSAPGRPEQPGETGPTVPPPQSW